MRVVATAGHVDHGKSTLVLALTGMDPDRFAEEKARGLTIDLGFAWGTLPSGQEFAFVDVPGHVRFIKNMLAGVGAVDACLFVVAATEGWKPQSEEHLRILELLGVRAGVVALTKMGLVDDEWREVAALDVADRVAGTFLADAEVVGVDAVAGVGLVELRQALDRLLTRVPGALDVGRPRLWVDRSFAAKGSGTVVTGTLAGGPLAVDDDVELWPSGLRARVRGLQSHKSALHRADPGRRLAVNLAGISHHDVSRGFALVRPGQWAPTRTVDVSLSVLAALDHDVSRRGAYVAYIGSGEHPVKVRLLGRASAVRPGEVGTARLHLPLPLPLLPGDRFVLRESGRAETVGGGEVLDVAPVLAAARAAPDRSVARVVAERGWVEADVLERLTGTRVAPNVGTWVVDPGALAERQGLLADMVAAAGTRGLDVAGLDTRDRLVLATVSSVVVRDGRAQNESAAEPASREEHPFLLALKASPFSPPSPDGFDRGEVRDLVRAGLVVERDGVYFAAEAVEAAAGTVARLLAEQAGPQAQAGGPQGDSGAEGLTVSEVREALGTSRKFLLPLLAHLDATGVTRRRGDLRIGGPRLPTTWPGGPPAARSS
ncbi:MAG: selenocysteine-specific elongation factor [Acidimicrobiaceae bacterium]|nr:selenocysteine-specific elongation factor [Acidimicrobiaceae bacterium]